MRIKSAGFDATYFYREMTVGKKMNRKGGVGTETTSSYFHGNQVGRDSGLRGRNPWVRGAAISIRGGNPNGTLHGRSNITPSMQGLPIERVSGRVDSRRPLGN